MRKEQLRFGAVGAIAVGLLVMTVLLAGPTDQAQGQDPAWDFSPDVAKCVLKHLDDVKADSSARLLLAACRSLEPPEIADAPLTPEEQEELEELLCAKCADMME